MLLPFNTHSQKLKKLSVMNLIKATTTPKTPGEGLTDSMKLGTHQRKILEFVRQDAVAGLFMSAFQRALYHSFLLDLEKDRWQAGELGASYVGAFPAATEAGRLRSQVQHLHPVQRESNSEANRTNAAHAKSSLSVMDGLFGFK